MDEAVRFSRDFSRIAIDEDPKEVFRPSHCAAPFERHASSLKARLADRFAGVTVVVNRFAPARSSIAERFAGSPLNA
ncbi:hypothetical protein [Aromatoleum petrolei]|uniref:hypothetical protein n=1 Tax=Aromatoleum petrolei TaxID=76116 RepID=UPI001FCFD6CF|nr:hypothetical protein [Aromatoleum petrolei]